MKSIVECIICGKKFFCYQYEYRKRKTCSKKCNYIKQHFDKTGEKFIREIHLKLYQ